MHFHFLINFSAMIWLSSIILTEFHLLYFSLALWIPTTPWDCKTSQAALLNGRSPRGAACRDCQAAYPAVEGELRNSMYFGCSIYPAMALIRLCFRYPNLCKVKFHAMSLDDHGLQVFSSCCPSLTDLTLSFCMNVHDLGLGFLACFKKLKSLRLNTLPAITLSGLLSVAVGCKNLSALHLIGCN